MAKMMRVDKIFTQAELAAALRIVDSERDVHKRLVSLVDPLMPRINAVTKQENDVNYFAYLLEYTVTRMKHG